MSTPLGRNAPCRQASPAKTADHLAPACACLYGDDHAPCVEYPEKVFSLAGHAQHAVPQHPTALRIEFDCQERTDRHDAATSARTEQPDRPLPLCSDSNTWPWHQQASPATGREAWCDWSMQHLPLCCQAKPARQDRQSCCAAHRSAPVRQQVTVRAEGSSEFDSILSDIADKVCAAARQPVAD